MNEQFKTLTTLDDVREFVSASYRATRGRSKWRSDGPLEAAPLPLPVAEPGPLIERAVQIAGADGITLTDLREVFSMLGAERFARGLRFARESGRLSEAREFRPNRAGRPQQQVVLRAAFSET